MHASLSCWGCLIARRLKVRTLLRNPFVAAMIIYSAGGTGQHLAVDLLAGVVCGFSAYALVRPGLFEHREGVRHTPCRLAASVFGVFVASYAFSYITLALYLSLAK